MKSACQHETMSLKLIRIARLKEFVASRRLEGPVAIGKAIGKKPNQVSDLMSGKAPFGEKVARSIEAFAGLTDNWLDSATGKESKAFVVGFTATPAVVQDEAHAYTAITLEAAVSRVAQHLESVDTYNVATAISLFSTLANDPTMHTVVAAGLKNLKPEARAPAKQTATAPEAGTSRAA
jgi:hypothetical protein